MRPTTLPSHASASGKSRGSVLVEVLVALVLLALMMASLAEGVDSALGRAQRLHDRAAGADDSAAHSGSLSAWDWGPEVASAVWHPGPVLDVEIQGGMDAGAVAGLWVDGWFLGERVPEASGCVSLGPSEWGDLEGAELVLRVRDPEDAWGSPWRSLVPDSTGGLSFLPEAVAGGASEPGVEAPVASIVHSPWLANPSLNISWSPDSLEADLAELVFELPPSSPGCSEAALGARTQSWWMEVGRGLDLYF